LPSDQQKKQVPSPISIFLSHKTSQHPSPYNVSTSRDRTQLTLLVSAAAPDIEEISASLQKAIARASTGNMTDFNPTSSDHHSDVTYPTTENNTILNGHAPATQGTKDAVIDSKVCWKESPRFLH
jgi:hypothetical protein